MKFVSMRFDSICFDSMGSVAYGICRTMGNVFYGICHPMVFVDYGICPYGYCPPMGIVTMENVILWKMSLEESCVLKR